MRFIPAHTLVKNIGEATLPQNYAAEKIIITFYLVLNLITLVVMNYSGLYVGDAIGLPFTVPLFDQLLVSLLLLLGYLFFYFVYRLISSSRHEVNQNAILILEILLFFGTLMGWLGFILFDYGKAEHQSNLAFGFIFRLIPYSVFWLIYISVVPKLTYRSVALIANFILLKLAMGWTGMLLAFFWVFFIRYFNAKNRSIGFMVFTVCILIGLFLVSPYIYSVKFYIRYSGNFSFDYILLLSKIVSRLSVLPNALFCLEESKAFVVEYFKYLRHGFYFFEPVSAVLPRSLLGIGGENLETIYVRLVTGDFNSGVIFYLGLLGKLIIYFNVGIEDFGNVFIVFLALIFCVGGFSRSMFLASARPFLFFVLLQLIVSGSFEEMAYTLYGVCLLFVLSRIRLVSRRGYDESWS